MRVRLARSVFLYALVSGWLIAAYATSAQAVVPEKIETPSMVPRKTVSESKLMERDLQRMSWKQFRSVVEAIPKLKAEIEAYGPAGWQYVRAKYPTYPWQKNIDRLDVADKQQLARLIQKAKTLR